MTLQQQEGGATPTLAQFGALACSECLCLCPCRGTFTDRLCDIRDHLMVLSIK